VYSSSIDGQEIIRIPGTGRKPAVSARKTRKQEREDILNKPLTPKQKAQLGPAGEDAPIPKSTTRTSLQLSD